VDYFRSIGIWIVFYLDDFLIVSASLQQSMADRDKVLYTLRHLGWFVNQEKSSLNPEQKKIYLGFIIDAESEIPTCRVPAEKLTRVRHDVTCLLNQAQKGPVPSKRVASVAGFCCSLTRAVIPAKMFLRDIYRCLGSRGSVNTLISLTPEAIENLKWWKENLQQWNGKALLPLAIDLTLMMDASRTGWGKSKFIGLDFQGYPSPLRSTSGLSQSETHSGSRQCVSGQIVPLLGSR